MINPVPEDFHTITPQLVVKGVAGAIDEGAATVMTTTRLVLSTLAAFVVSQVLAVAGLTRRQAAGTRARVVFGNRVDDRLHRASIATDRSSGLSAFPVGPARGQVRRMSPAQDSTADQAIPVMQ